jgi:hypothetical protein
LKKPRIPRVFTQVKKLGAATSFHPINGWLRWCTLFIAGFIIMIAGLVLLVGGYDTFIAVQKHGAAMIDDVLSGPLLVAAVLFCTGLLFGLIAAASWNKGVMVHEGGIVFHDWRGTRAWRWMDVDSMNLAVTNHSLFGISIGSTHSYTLKNHQAQKLVFSDGLSQVEDLAKSIDQHVFPLLYARFSEQYNEGQVVSFGVVKVNRDGISIGSRSVQWKDVKEAALHQGVLKVLKKGDEMPGGITVSASGIPNLQVLLAMVQQMVELKIEG